MGRLREGSRDRQPATNPNLLLRLRDEGNQEAWEEFVATYDPLIRGYCRKHRLQEADAADVAQEVLVSVSGAIRHFDYDRKRGRFRSWLLTVTRRKLVDYYRRLRRYQSVGDRALADLDPQRTAGAPGAAEWPAEGRLEAFQKAAARVRCEVSDRTWKAFVATTLEERPSREVAAELGMSVGAVYIAKCRVLARLREQMAARTGTGHPPGTKGRT